MSRPRARELGLPLQGQPGPLNAITDVPGVQVGYQTLIAGEAVRTGVTVVLPLGCGGVGRSCPAGWHSLNGNGEITGVAWLEESGALSLPVGITSTHSVGAVHRGIIDWSMRTQPWLASRWLLPVVAETWDGYLNDANGAHVTPEVTASALEAAGGGPVAEGSVGGGTGMNCYGFKGGTGTSSRRVCIGPRTYTVGVLMQANFGSRAELVVAGRRLGEALADDNPLESGWLARPGGWPHGAGSCVTVVATDAPLLPGQCAALARRVPLGLARTGTAGSHFSGDLFLAFSASNVGALDSDVTGHDPVAPLPSIEFLPWGLLDPLYAAVVQATEEAVLNVLAASETMTGRDGHRSPGFPADRLGELLAR